MVSLTYTGFIYLWHDMKRNMWYIGSHMGTINDGYVCSSKRMIQVYKNRPETFRRRIIEYHNGRRKDLIVKEHLWLSMIKPHEATNKYYNVNNRAWDAMPDEMRHALNTKLSWTPERRAAQAERMRIRKAAQTPEERSAAIKKKWDDPEYREKMSTAHKNRNDAWTTQPEKMKEANRKANVGRKVSDETRKKMREAALRRITPEWAIKQAEKMRAAK